MAIRFDASGDSLKRTANLPTATAFTACGWAQVASDRGTVYQTLVSLESPSIYLALLWEGGTSNAGGLERTGGTANNFASRPATGVPFFWAITSAAGGVNAYWRSTTQLTFITASITAFSGTPASLFFGNSGATEWLDGRMWNVKVWDRALTAAELLVESHYRRVMFPSSLNFHWPLDNLSTTQDFGGNARPATVGGTLTTEDGPHGLWQPRHQLFVPASGAASIDIASAGALTITGAASLDSSVGTLAAAGALTITGAALLNATGTIAGAGTLLITGSAALTSTGTLASAGTLVIVGGATLTAQGTLAAAGTLVINGSASMPGLNDMVSAGNLTISAAAALTAIGSLASAGTVTITGAAPLTSIGTLASAGTVVITGASNITAPSANDMAAAGTILITSSAELSAVGSLAASGALTILGAALLDDGAVVVTAQQNSGGWPIFAMEYERELSRRRKERARRLELEDEAEQIPEQVSREIAALLHEQEAKTAKRQELERLRDLAKELGAEEAERQLGQRVAAALSRAVEQGNYSALEALDREIARAQSDEEDWLLAVTMLLADD